MATVDQTTTSPSTGAVPMPATPMPPFPPLPVLVQSVLFGQGRQWFMPLLRRHYGDVFGVRLAGGRTFVILTQPDDIRTVFTGSTEVYHAGEGNAVLSPIMGEHSVLVVDEDEHRRVRKLLMPAFHGAALRGYQDMVAQLARAEVTRWPANREFRAHDRMNALTLEIILQVVVGVTDPARLAKLRPLVRAIVGMNPAILLGWSYPALRRLGPWQRFERLKDALDRVLYAEIAAHRASPDLADRRDVLSRLLSVSEDGDRLSDSELRDQLVTLLLAGHETTATTLAWSLHELARRPDLLRVAQRAADNDDEEYLGAIVKEALRLRPVVFEVVRKLTEPVRLAGYTLPAGTMVSPAIGLVQSDPLFYDDPTDFRPERFLGGQPAANTWIPFGGGARRCPGAGFSLMEATIALREILVRYDIRPDRTKPEPVRARNITLFPGRGARITVVPRLINT